MKSLTTDRPLPWPVLLLLMLIWGGRPITGLLLGVSLRLPFLKAFAQSVPQIVTVILIILSMPYLLKKIKVVDYAFYLIIVSVFIFNYAIYPNNASVLDNYAYLFLVASVPIYFIGVSFDIEKLFKGTVIVSVVVLFVGATSTFLLGKVEELTQESMTAAHIYYPHVMMMILCFFVQKRFKWIYLVFAFIGLFLLLVFANRASVLAVVCFLACCLFLMPATTKRQSNIKRVFAVLLVFVAIYYVNYLVVGLENFTSYFGTSSRMVDYINEGDAFDSNGRDYLWQQMLYHIGHNPFGIGLGGDRLVIDTWSHNIFLEILLSFGWIFGSILILLLFYVMYLGYRYAQNTIQRFFLILLFFSGVFKLQFSASFLNETYLYFMIGYCIFLYRNRNNISTSEPQL